MSFDEETIQQVWEKGTEVTSYPPNFWRKDDCEAWIRRNAYGNRDSQYGWEIDHIKPESEGGGDELSNLRPLQCQNNDHKQARRLGCVVTSSGENNVPVE